MVSHYILTHSAFVDSRKGIPAREATLVNGPVFNGEVAAADAVRRYTNAGATDAKAVELSADQYRAVVSARLPKLIA